MTDLLKQWLEQVEAFFTPKKLYSWHTALILWLLAWLAALITTEPIRFLLMQSGWIFLIIGIGWMTTENPLMLWGLSLSPWITGLFVCVFLFVTDLRSGIPRIALITWPISSALIAAFPSTFSPESGFHIPPVKDRPRLLVLFLSNLLIFCWLLFSFQIQDWLNSYPELKQERFEESSFVVAIGRPSLGQSRGVQVVNWMAETVNLQANGNTRSQVEKWLFDLQNDPAMSQQFRATVMENLLAQERREQTDEAFWQLEIVITEPEYQLILGARWMGPSSRQEQYLVQQVCQISFTGDKPEDLARVECSEAKRVKAKG